MKPFQDYRLYADIIWVEDFSVAEKSRSKIPYQNRKQNISSEVKNQH